MKCPKCGERACVLDVVNSPGKTYRRRQCRECGKIFHTSEAVVEDNDDSFEEEWSKFYRKHKRRKNK